MGEDGSERALGPEAFLRGLPPFDHLDDTTLATALAALEVTYVASGTRVLHRGGEPSGHLHVVRKGTALLSFDGVPIRSVEPGEWFGLPSVLHDQPPQFDVDAVEDLLVYRLPGPVVAELARDPVFAEQVTRDLASRLRAASSGAGRGAATPTLAPVSSLATRELVTLPAYADVGQIARTMREHGVSSVVLDTDPPGIVTTRDLRDRVLARDRGPTTPGAEVASSPILAVDAATPLIEARIRMLEGGLHHLGVEQDGQLQNMITTGDLLRHDASSPLHVQRELETAPRGAAGRFPQRLHATVAGLLAGGIAPVEATRAISLLTDVLVRRAIELASEQLGPAPAPFAWLTLGSDARREQTLLSDQDHALVHGEVDETGAAWFQHLALDVTDQLAESGLPRCPGGVMATNWSGQVEVWRERYERWLAEPDVRALYETSIFFDHRVVAGTLDVGDLDEVVLEHRDDGVLLARMAASASTSRPPLGLLQRLRSTADGTVDLKAGGINPIVSLARVLAVEAGSTARSTLDRLAAATAHGGLSPDAAEELTEAFGFLQRLRLDLQLEARRGGGEATNRIVLDRMIPSRRKHLKEAFVAIARVQQATVGRLGGDEVSR